MPTKIRLQRRGRGKKPFYHIVITDGRAPRDGRFIESIGTYNPLTSPASIELDNDKALTWLQNGAQPTETVRAILKYKGVLLKLHLAKGVAKGALTQEKAEQKYNAWISEKEAKIQSKINQDDQKNKTDLKKRMEAEIKIKEERAKAIAEKRAKAAEKAKPAEQEVVDNVEVENTDNVETQAPEQGNE